jgi:hypothetical protein
LLQNALGKSSGVIAVGANTTILATPTVVTAVILRAGSAASSISLLDGSAGTSQLIIGNAATDSNAVVVVPFPNGLVFPNGLYVTVAGTAATAYVVYQPA